MRERDCRTAMRDCRRASLVIGGSDGGLNTVLAAILDLVHRRVGGLHQLLGRGRHVGQGGDADRGGQVDVEAVARRETGGPRSARGCARRPRTRPRRPVSGRTSANSSPPNRATTSVSRALPRMTAAASTSARLPHRWPWVSLIDLEAVEIDEQQRQRPAAARGALGLAAQHLVQVARVVQAASGRR